MIPRFTSSFSVRDAWGALVALFANEPGDPSFYARLFPDASVYEVSSARTGIACALSALQLGHNARIGVQPYTCSSVMVAIRKAGCHPVFIDIDETLTLDIDDLTVKIRGLDALIVTHTFGMPANVARIREIAGSVPIIEDCAHAFGSRYEGVQVGNFFDMAVFSFGNGKFPALGSGGLLVVNNKRYAEAVSQWVNRLKPNSLLSEVAFIGRQLICSLLYSRLGYQILYTFFRARLVDRGRGIDSHAGQERGMYRTVRWQLRTGASAIRDAAVRQRSNALAIIETHQAGFNFIYNPDPDSACFALVCTHEHRDDLFNYLIDNGIGAGKHFQYAAVWASSFGYQHGTCPNFDRFVDQIITIPCHDALTPADLSIIDNALAQHTKRASLSERLIPCS